MTIEMRRLMANAIRFLAADAVEAAGSGHPGLPMGAADIATVLLRDLMRVSSNITPIRSDEQFREHLR